MQVQVQLGAQQGGSRAAAETHCQQGCAVSRVRILLHGALQELSRAAAGARQGLCWGTASRVHILLHGAQLAGTGGAVGHAPGLTECASG